MIVADYLSQQIIECREAGNAQRLADVLTTVLELENDGDAAASPISRAILQEVRDRAAAAFDASDARTAEERHRQATHRKIHDLHTLLKEIRSRLVDAEELADDLMPEDPLPTQLHRLGNEVATAREAVAAMLKNDTHR